MAAAARGRRFHRFAPGTINPHSSVAQRQTLPETAAYLHHYSLGGFPPLHERVDDVLIWLADATRGVFHSSFEYAHASSAFAVVAVVGCVSLIRSVQGSIVNRPARGGDDRGACAPALAVLVPLVACILPLRSLSRFRAPDRIDDVRPVLAGIHNA